MITSPKKLLTTAITGLCALLFSAGNLWAGEYRVGEYIVTQLTDNGYDDSRPQIHNGQVVWRNEVRKELHEEIEDISGYVNC